MEIYEPQEDSQFLKQFVKTLARGRVLDMGTGSGIQALTALENKIVREVVAVDINETALLNLKMFKKEKMINKLKVQKSNLFESIKGKFDTIIFNPPYLPDDETDKDIALYGGKEGNELIIEFLNQAKSHLEEKGFILLLFSNLTGKESLEKFEGVGYSSEFLGKKTLPFFEELYVYLLKLNKQRTIFKKGKRGVIYREGNVCIKERNPDAKVDTLENEARMLQILNKVGVGPRYISFDGKRLERDFIEGMGISEYLKSCSRKDALSIIKDVLSQCRKLDQLKINKTELTNPYKDILVTPKTNAVLIDFERCKRTEKPQNVNQFIQYIIRQKKALLKKKIIFDEKELMKIGKEYKLTFSDDNFQKILSAFK